MVWIDGSGPLQRKTSFNNDSVKAGTGRRCVEEQVSTPSIHHLLVSLIFRFLGGCLGPKTNCYTLEVSFFGSKTGDVHIPYTEDDCIHLHLLLSSKKSSLARSDLNQ